VILGYRLEVDPAPLGLPVTASSHTARTGQLPRSPSLARRLGQVSECHGSPRKDCFLVKVHAASVPDLEELLDQFLTYGQTVSSIVVHPRAAATLPLPAKIVQDKARRQPNARLPDPPQPTPNHLKSWRNILICVPPSAAADVKNLRQIADTCAPHVGSPPPSVTAAGCRQRPG